MIQGDCCACGSLGHIKGTNQVLAMLSSQSLSTVLSTIAFSQEILQQRQHDF